MRRSNMSKYLSKNAVFGFLESYDCEEEEISDLHSISTDDGKEDVEEISLCDSSSEEEMDKQLVLQARFLWFCKLLCFQNLNLANNTFCK